MSKTKGIMMTLLGKNRITNDTFKEEHHFQKREKHLTLEKTFQETYHHLKRIVERENLRNRPYSTTEPLRLLTS